MSEKCYLCGEKVEESSLGKLNGTIVKVKRNTKTGKEYICRDCQIKHKDKLMEVVNER